MVREVFFTKIEGGPYKSFKIAIPYHTDDVFLYINNTIKHRTAYAHSIKTTFQHFDDAKKAPGQIRSYAERYIKHCGYQRITRLRVSYTAYNTHWIYFKIF